MINGASVSREAYGASVLPAQSDALEKPGYYLLLDAIAKPGLERWLYEILESPDYEPLYLNTPLNECREVSPCLVSLESAESLWDAFMAHGAKEKWGWLLFSTAPREQLLAHLRWLLMAKHPLHGRQVLRIASPLVMQQLLAIEDSGEVALMLGDSIERVWLPAGDNVAMSWWCADNRNLASNHFTDVELSTFELKQAHLDAIAVLNWQRFQARLAAHLQRYFSSSSFVDSYDSNMSAAARVIELTRHLGFVGQRAHYYMANILAVYGEDALDSNKQPELAKLLVQSSHQAPMERLKHAVTLAQQALQKD